MDGYVEKMYNVEQRKIPDFFALIRCRFMIFRDTTESKIELNWLI